MQTAAFFFLPPSRQGLSPGFTDEQQKKLWTFSSFRHPSLLSVSSLHFLELFLTFNSLSLSERGSNRLDMRVSGGSLPFSLTDWILSPFTDEKSIASLPSSFPSSIASIFILLSRPLSREQNSDVISRIRKVSEEIIENAGLPRTKDEGDDFYHYLSQIAGISPLFAVILCVGLQCSHRQFDPSFIIDTSFKISPSLSLGIHCRAKSILGKGMRSSAPFCLVYFF